jgi:hypothetical protein
MKILAIILLATLSLNAYSQKLLLATSTDAKIYVEQSSILKSGEYKTASLYYEFENKKHGASSMITENIYDCKQKSFKSRKLVMHELEEGKGIIIAANYDGDEEWIHPLLNTSGFDVLKYICKN